MEALNDLVPKVVVRKRLRRSGGRWRRRTRSPMLLLLRNRPSWLHCLVLKSIQSVHYLLHFHALISLHFVHAFHHLHLGLKISMETDIPVGLCEALGAAAQLCQPLAAARTLWAQVARRNWVLLNKDCMAQADCLH